MRYYNIRCVPSHYDFPELYKKHESERNGEVTQAMFDVILNQFEVNFKAI